MSNAAGSQRKGMHGACQFYCSCVTGVRIAIIDRPTFIDCGDHPTLATAFPALPEASRHRLVTFAWAAIAGFEGEKVIEERIDEHTTPEHGSPT